jgi:hypothetical protein
METWCEWWNLEIHKDTTQAISVTDLNLLKTILD